MKTFRSFVEQQEDHRKVFAKKLHNRLAEVFGLEKGEDKSNLSDSFVNLYLKNPEYPDMKLNVAPKLEIENGLSDTEWEVWIHANVSGEFSMRFWLNQSAQDYLTIPVGGNEDPWSNEFIEKITNGLKYQVTKGIQKITRGGWTPNSETEYDWMVALYPNMNTEDLYKIIQIRPQSARYLPNPPRDLQKFLLDATNGRAAAYLSKLDPDLEEKYGHMRDLTDVGVV